MDILSHKTLLSRSFYTRDTVTVAHDLIGKILVRTIGSITLAGLIIETEAYQGSDDPASHAYRGLTPRNAPMFGPVGHLYVYFIYGNYYCVNIVAKSSVQKAGAVLIRAIEPIVGMEHMQQHRGIHHTKHIANGPGKLTQALQITKQHNAIDCTQSQELFVLDTDHSLESIATPRIGITRATDKLWRFVISR